MTLLKVTALMVLPPLLVGVSTWVLVAALNGAGQPGDDWVGIFLALTLGAITWMGCWTWIRIQFGKEENK